MLAKATIALLGLLTAAYAVSYGQSMDSTANKVLNFPTRLFGKIQNRTADLDRQLTKQTERYLQKLASREARLKKKIARLDPTAASRLFSSSVQRQYAVLEANMRRDTTAATANIRGQYLAGLDSIKVGLSFLQQNPQLLGGSAASALNATQLNAATGALSSAEQAQLKQLQTSLTDLQQLQAKMANTDQVQDFIRQRKAAIRDYLSHLANAPSGLGKEYRGFNQDLYYYDQQVEQYKQLLNDPDKLEKKALSLLNQLPAFQQFMRNNSQLASLFGVPGNSGTAQALAGLQTRDQLQQLVQGQLAAGGPNAMSALQNNLQSAQSQLDELKDKLEKWGTGGPDMDDPKFKPNNEKTKTLFQRLEYGFNLQTARNNYFPVTTDAGLSLGYKLNNSATIGVGASYKIGWGTSIQHIALSDQGIGLRSYLDVKLKGSFYLSGGYEYNYTTAYANLPPSPITQLPSGATGWTRSGLIGVSKIVSLQSRFLKKTKVQLLWDFLSYQQMPHTQPILFRMGYSLN